VRAADLANQFDAWRYFERSVIKLVAATQPHERHMVRITDVELLDSGEEGLLGPNVRVEGSHENGHFVWAFFPGDMAAFVARLLGAHAAPGSCPRCGGELYVCRSAHTDGPRPRVHCKSSASHNFKLEELGVTDPTDCASSTT
jgi:hypothetical protein